jgi:hypothetical protein
VSRRSGCCYAFKNRAVPFTRGGVLYLLNSLYCCLEVRMIIILICHVCTFAGHRSCELTKKVLTDMVYAPWCSIWLSQTWECTFHMHGPIFLLVHMASLGLLARHDRAVGAFPDHCGMVCVAGKGRISSSVTSLPAKHYCMRATSISSSGQRRQPDVDTRADELKATLKRRHECLDGPQPESDGEELSCHHLMPNRMDSYTLSEYFMPLLIE